MKNRTKSFKIGEMIQWKWLGRSISGVVVEVHVQPVLKKIKDKAIKRNGSNENPAYLVQSEAGNLALKLHSELQKLQIEKNKPLSPKMFKV